MLTINELQSDVAPWAENNFPRDVVETGLLGLAEEVGEACRAALKRQQGIRGTHDEWTAELRKELGDVFIKLLHVAHLEGVDLQAAVEERWDVIKLRDFRADSKGHGLPDA